MPQEKEVAGGGHLAGLHAGPPIAKESSGDPQTQNSSACQKSSKGSRSKADKEPFLGGD